MYFTENYVVAYLSAQHMNPYSYMASYEECKTRKFLGHIIISDKYVIYLSCHTIVCIST